MTEKISTEKRNTESNFKKERFEFILSINDNIVCQRYFRIIGFKDKCYSSLEIIEAIDKCINMIDLDLKIKTQLYINAVAPQLFDSVEQMKEYYAKHTEVGRRPTFSAIRGTNLVFLRRNGEITPWEKPFNFNEFDGEYQDDVPNTLKFTFIDNGFNYYKHEEKRVVCEKQWDANVYPKFVRTNIDLSSSKNKYRKFGIEYVMESTIMDMFATTGDNLIPQIVQEICSVCSYEDTAEYTTAINFGNKTYSLNNYSKNEKYLRSLEDKEKSSKYFSYRK